MKRVHHVPKQGDEFWDLSSKPDAFRVLFEIPFIQNGDFVVYRYVDEDGNLGKFWFSVVVFFDAKQFPIVVRSSIPGYVPYGMATEPPPATVDGDGNPIDVQ